MSTGRDELLMAVVDYDLGHPEIDELSDIGDGQHLCSVAADLIHELRQEVDEKQEQIFELEEQLAEEKAARKAAVQDLLNASKEGLETAVGAHRLEQRIEQLEEQLRRLGACPDCGQVEQMVEGEPFSICACGKGEDYGRRPLQQLQLIQRIAQRSYGVAYSKQKGPKHV